jgi:hypothetical protein
MASIVAQQTAIAGYVRGVAGGVDRRIRGPETKRE